MCFYEVHGVKCHQDSISGSASAWCGTNMHLINLKVDSTPIGVKFGPSLLLLWQRSLRVLDFRDEPYHSAGLRGSIFDALDAWTRL